MKSILIIALGALYLSCGVALANPIADLLQSAARTGRVGGVRVRTPPASAAQGRFDDVRRDWGTSERANMVLRYSPRSAGNATVSRFQGTSLKFDLWLHSGKTRGEFLAEFGHWSDRAVPIQEFQAPMVSKIQTYKANVRRILNDNGIDSESVLPSRNLYYVTDGHNLTPGQAAQPYRMGIDFILRNEHLEVLDLSVIQQIVEAGARL